MRPRKVSTLPSSPRWTSSSDRRTSSTTIVRDRDYLLDQHGIIFKVVGDTHPPDHYAGYVKYYPDTRGDRRLFGRTYRQNSVVSKSFGVLADRPDCYVYSAAVGCVITGVPRGDIATHYSCRQALESASKDPTQIIATRIGQDLLAIIRQIESMGAPELFGVTGSFLVGCANDRSDIDLVCYGTDGYEAARELFADTRVIRPYEGQALHQLYLRRAKYMEGNAFANLIEQELRKLQGLTKTSGAHINCEPLRSDGERATIDTQAKEIGEISLIARVIDHTQGLTTPAMYRIQVERIISSTVDEPESFAQRINYLRSYLGAYTGAFREGDTVHIVGKLVHLQDEINSAFGIELTPWSVSKSYLANLTTAIPIA